MNVSVLKNMKNKLKCYHNHRFLFFINQVKSYSKYWKELDNVKMKNDAHVKSTQTMREQTKINITNLCRKTTQN